MSVSPSSSKKTQFCEREGQKYIAGYLAAAFHVKYPDFGEKTCDKSIFEPNNSPWIYALSRGGLTVPSAELVNKVNEFDKIFDSIHGSDICRKPNVIKRLTEAISTHFPAFPHEVIQKFSKTRTFIRIKTLNEQLKVEAESIKARNALKRKHFTS